MGLRLDKQLAIRLAALHYLRPQWRIETKPEKGGIWRISMYRGDELAGRTSFTESQLKDWPKNLIMELIDETVERADQHRLMMEKRLTDKRTQ